jgi:hypothetical protein
VVVCGVRSCRSRPESTGDGGGGKGDQEGLVWVGVEWDGMGKDTGPNFGKFWSDENEKMLPLHFPDGVMYITSSTRSAYV